MDTIEKSKVSTITNSWRASDLVVIGGRPAMGKTALAASLAIKCAGNNNIPVAIFSLEMSDIQLCQRLMKHKIEPTMPLYIDDTPAISIDHLRTTAKRLCKDNGVKVVFIDYLQLMKGDERLKTLKSIAIELDVTIVCLSQLPRSVEEREDKRPKLSDLEHIATGATEYADTILFIHRDEYYDWDLEDDRAEIIAAKHYDDSLSGLELRFNKRQGIFLDK